MISRSSRVLFLSVLLLVGAFAAEARAGSPVGRWQGKWFSAPTGHQGPLRARIRRTPAGDYRALFAGRFFGVIPFAYRARLEPTGMPGQYVSVKRLPLVGEYRMSATITPSRFHAHFESRRDTGIFEMRRR
jgi:hypothetical protein